MPCWRRCLSVEVVKGKLSEGWKSLCGEVGRPLWNGLLLLAVAVAVLRWRGSGWKNGWWELCCGVLEAVVLVIRSRAGVASCIPGSLAATKTGGARSAGSAALGPARSAANHVPPNHIVPFCSLQGYYSPVDFLLDSSLQLSTIAEYRHTECDRYFDAARILDEAIHLFTSCTGCLTQVCPENR